VNRTVPVYPALFWRLCIVSRTVPIYPAPFFCQKYLIKK